MPAAIDRLLRMLVLRRATLGATRGIAAALLATSGGCQSTTDGQRPVIPVADSGATYVPDASWRTALPTAVGLDPARAAALERDVADGRYGGVDGLLVVRFGYLAIERYVHGTREQTHTMQSVTKSVTSLLFRHRAREGRSGGRRPRATRPRRVPSLYRDRERRRPQARPQFPRLTAASSTRGFSPSLGMTGDERPANKRPTTNDAVPALIPP